MLNNEIVHIVAVADDRYAQHIGVTCASLVFHKPRDRTINVHIIDGGISLFNKQLLQQTLDKLGLDMKFIPINTSIYTDLVVSQHITLAAYYRLSIPELFEEMKINKVIYLDCDLIIKDDICVMWDIDLCDYTIAAVADIGGILRLKDLNIPSHYKYFNSGVMIINLIHWRKNQVTSKVLQFLMQNREKIQYHDQDGLNAILYNQWLVLPPKWNMQMNMLNCVNKAYFGEELLKEAIEHPSIIHYTGSSKPWQYDNTHPLKSEYYQYLQITEWNSYKPAKSFKIIIKRIVKEILPQSVIMFFIRLKSF
jgi:lipopolysaccharide biosynthesis glycosyltransferase